MHSQETIQTPDTTLSLTENPDLNLTTQNKAVLSPLLTQLIIAPTLIAQNLVSQLGSNIQDVVGLINTTHHTLLIKPNTTLNSYTNALANVAAAHAVLLTNQTNAFLVHLDTNKEISKNVSQAIVQAASSWINSTASLAVVNWQIHISLGQAIIKSFLQVRLQSINSTARAHQTIVRGFGTLLEQKMLHQQLFYGNISVLIQNITEATIYDLQRKVNETHSPFEYLKNKTLMAGNAISGVMAALIDTKNSSALSFVSRTTILLDTIADIVNATHNISSTVFANKTEHLLQSIGNVFDVLANGSHSKHDNGKMLTKFNTSVHHLTDAMLRISESVAEHKNIVADRFSSNIESVLLHMEIAHDNVTQDLQSLFVQLSSALTAKVDELATIPNHLLRHLAEDLAETRIRFDETIKAVGVALQRSVEKLRQHVKVAERGTEETAIGIYYLLNEDFELFKCAQELLPAFEYVVANRAMKPIYCSADTLSLSLSAVFDHLDQFFEENYRKNECHKSVEKRADCLPALIAGHESFNVAFGVYLKDFVTTLLPDAFNTESCYAPQTIESSFEVIQQKLMEC